MYFWHKSTICFVTHFSWKCFVKFNILTANWKDSFICLYVITYPIFNDFRTFELLFSPKYAKEIKEKQNKMKMVMVSGCHPAAMSFWQEWEMLCYLFCYIFVILESMQSICAEDGKLISKRVKPFKIPPKILNFGIETTPLHFLKLWSSGPHRSPPCYSILLFVLIGLTKLKFSLAGEALARWGTLL